MLTPRQNQVAAIEAAAAFFKEQSPKPSLIVLPTAWGKSVLAAFTAKSTNGKLLVVQPSKELLEQNKAKYEALCGADDVGVYSAACGRKDLGRITFATIGSIKTMGAAFREMGYSQMLIDEAHLYPREADSMLGRFLNESGITKVLGLTATPLKPQVNFDQSGKQYTKLVMLTSRSKKGNFFKEIIHIAQTSEMVRLGYWSPLVYECADFRGELLRLNSTGADFTDESVAASYTADGIEGRILEALSRHKDRRRVLVFVPLVADAETLARKAGDAAYVCGETPKKERERIIGGFKAGAIRTLFNVGVLTTGFDCTTIDCVILARPTMSVSLYYQIIGRGTRIDPAKKDCLIIDLCGNVKRFGRVEDLRYERGRVWRLFGTGGRLLTGIPVRDIGKVIEADTAGEDRKARERVMPFGRHKGCRMCDIPKNYLSWLLQNYKFDERSEWLRQSICAALAD